MQIEVFLTANRAAVDNMGLLAVEGGAWEHFNFPVFPNTMSGYAAGVVNLDESELGSGPLLRLDVSDDAGQVEEFHASMMVNGMRPATVAGVPSRVAFAIPFMTVTKGPTVVNVRLFDESGAELDALTFAVIGGVPDAPPPLD